MTLRIPHSGTPRAPVVITLSRYAPGVGPVLSAKAAPIVAPITLQRLFKLSERFSLQTSADFFNIFNHPNFGAPINYMTSPQFGQSTQMLNAWLGSGGQSGGLNPLYQIGGPRSIQLALKLQF